MRQQHACGHRTPQSSMDHFQPSVNRKTTLMKFRGDNLITKSPTVFRDVSLIWLEEENLKHTYVDWDLNQQEHHLRGSCWMPYPFLSNIKYSDNNTHVYYHFTALAGSYLCEDLQNKGLGDIPGQIPHIPGKKQGKRWEELSLCQTGSSMQTKAS